MKNIYFNTLLPYTSYWYSKPYNEYVSQKIFDKSTTDTIHLDGDCFDGSVVNGIRESILFNFVLNEPPG